jgi:hypothetical protein
VTVNHDSLVLKLTLVKTFLALDRARPRALRRACAQPADRSGDVPATF